MFKSESINDLKLLKIILWIYIILCVVIAGLNYGYAGSASAPVADMISKLWHFYENWVKTLFILVGSILTLRIVGKGKTTTMRKKNLRGFLLAALLVHIAGPLLLGNSELYFFTMPLPWTTTPLQLLDASSNFYQSRFPVWGRVGISTALIFFGVYSVIVVIGTLLLGRRWQCSTLCLFNGFAAEVFAPAIPLAGRRKMVKPRTLKMLAAAKWVFLVVSILFSMWWILRLTGRPLVGVPETISKIENYKYLSTELLTTMFFWVAFIGRGYCYYCPLGTVVGFLSKAAGQKIITNRTNCIQCNQCNLICPMTLDVKAKAQAGKPLKASLCVGCGHCVDICPTKTLAYQTQFLDWKNSLVKEIIQ